MAVWSDTELLGYLTDFGQPINIGDETEYVTIWATVTAQSIDSLEVESVARVMTCRASDVAGVARGAGVTVDEDESYSVLRVRPRNDGLADVLLVVFGAAVAEEDGENGHGPPPKPPKPGEDEPEPELPGV